MSKSKPYAWVNVKDVNLPKLLKELQGRDLWVGIDVAKEHLLVVLSWGEQLFARPWRVNYPEQLGLLVQMLKTLAEGRKLTVAIEPTGSYADPLRWALTMAKLAVVRIESKASHDYAEIFDGVPSQHDGKDAAALAELARHGKGTAWPLELKEERESTMRALVEAADDQQRVGSVWAGRLEGLLSRHWPEATRILELDSVTLLKTLMEHGGPAGLAQDPLSREKLSEWGGVWLKPEKVEALIQSAGATAGVPANEAERGRLQQYAASALEAQRELTGIRHQLEKMTKGDAVLERMGCAVGKATACVLFVLLGDPRNYSNVRAYLKAAGLNLAERSSGQYQGQLRISKRGPATVRRWLYLAVLRLIQKEPASTWYQRKRERDGGGGQGPRRKKTGLIAIVALMRRLLGSVWQITRKQESFDVDRLFGSRRRAGRLAVVMTLSR